MFDNLLKLVQENAGEAIINNAAIPNEKNDAAIQATTNSIFDSLKSQAMGGNINNLMDMFNPATPPNANVTSSLSSHVTTGLMEKLGINSSHASGIASAIVSLVMGKLVSKTNDPNDNSFDMNSILGALGAGNSGNMLGELGKMFK